MRSGEDARRSRIVRLAAEGRLLVRLSNTARYRDDRGSAPTNGYANAPSGSRALTVSSAVATWVATRAAFAPMRSGEWMVQRW